MLIFTNVLSIKDIVMLNFTKGLNIKNDAEIGKSVNIKLGFNDMSTFVGHFVSSPREKKKRQKDSRGDEKEGQGVKRKRNESEETEEIKTFPLYPYLLQG